MTLAGRPILAAAAFRRGAKSILIGWITLLLIAYLIERPLLLLMAGIITASWFPTFHLGLDCSLLAVLGWLLGRFAEPGSKPTVLLFAATLALQNLELLQIRVPWLLQLTADALRDRHYWDSLFDTAVTQTFLFGSLFAGARLSRSRQPLPSIVDNK